MNLGYHSNIDIKISEEIKRLKFEISKKSKILRHNLKLENIEIDNLEKTLRNLKNKKDDKNIDLKKHEDKCVELRKSNCQRLLKI